MESSQSATPKKKGLKKLWAKVKASVRSEPSRSQKESVAGPSVPTERVEEPTAAQQPVPAAEPVKPVAPTSEPTTTEERPKETAGETERPAQTSDVIEIDYEEEYEEISLPQTYIFTTSTTSDKARFDRARAVFEKYNFTLEPAEWHAQSKSNVLRVEKKPRMRVRWTCDACNKTFGRDKICSNCAHKRCPNCSRYPPKKTGEKTKKDQQKAEIIPSNLTDVPTTGACHDCKTDFAIGAPECANCGHKICQTCLKETIMASPATAPPPPRNTSLTAT